MIIKVKHQTDFVVENQKPIKSKELSWGAKGLLTFLMSLPHDWEINLNHLATVSKDSVDATRSVLNELMREKYVMRIKKREGGKFKYDYLVSDFKQEEPSEEVVKVSQEITEVSQPMPTPKNNKEEGIPFAESPIASLEDFIALLTQICPRANAKHYHKKISNYAKSKCLLKADWTAYVELWIQTDIEKGKLKVLKEAEQTTTPEQEKEEHVERGIKRVREDVQRQLQNQVTYTMERWDNYVVMLRSLWKLGSDTQRDSITQLAITVQELRNTSPSQSQV